MKADNELLQVLCPFGEWPHPKGTQIVDEESARSMKRAAAWKSLTGIPIYIGHPDDGGKKTPAVGRVKRICRTKGGIAVVAEYSKAAYEQIVGGKYRAMSPRWQMKPLGNGKFRPVKLISVGLTNNPNIEPSGRILEFLSAPDALSEYSRRGRIARDRIKKLSESAKSCSRALENIRKSVASLEISERLAVRKARESRAETPAASLADMARERSKRLGEPYTKSFAAVKREHLNGKRR